MIPLRQKIGLVEICDVCGKPLLKGQKLGKKKSNNALCHGKCLYYAVNNRQKNKQKKRTQAIDTIGKERASVIKETGLLYAVAQKVVNKRLVFPEDFINKIICGDTLEVMRQIPNGSVDLVVTSPPYNLKNSTGNGMKDGRGGKWANAALQKGYTHHDDCMPHDKYVKWQRECLSEMMRIIPEDGAIFYNHKWRVQGGLLQDRNDIVSGFPVRQIIIWKRKGGLNFNAGYFLPTYEVIYLIAKPDFKLASKANSYGDVWEFTQEMNNRHPAAFPVTLIDRIVSSTGAKIVLDPFMGSGTTAIAAINNQRNFAGIEISPEYCDMALKRIRQYSLQPKLL